MRSRHIPMSIEAFHRLEWELGWKYEYWDGCAHISPRGVAMECSMPVAPPRGGIPSVETAPVSPAHADVLLESFLAAFRDGVEYCDWPEDRLVQNARETIEGFFTGLRGRPLAASRLIREAGRTDAPLLGALLLVQTGENVALTDLLFVVPDRQRQGLATAMATGVLCALHDMGFSFLESRYSLTNRASRAWHHRFGFADRPDSLSARILLAHARHELDRAHLVGNADAERLSRLAAEVAHWEAALARLDDIEQGNTQVQQPGVTRNGSRRAP